MEQTIEQDMEQAIQRGMDTTEWGIGQATEQDMELTPERAMEQATEQVWGRPKNGSACNLSLILGIGPLVRFTLRSHSVPSTLPSVTACSHQA